MSAQRNVVLSLLVLIVLCAQTVFAFGAVAAVEDAGTSAECGWCGEWWNDQTQELNHTFAGGTFWMDGPVHYEWYWGPCSMHLDCPDDPAAMALADRVHAEAAGWSAERLRGVIGDHEELVVNYGRNSLQVLGCGGQVVAQIPLDAEILRALGD